MSFSNDVREALVALIGTTFGPTYDVSPVYEEMNAVKKERYPFFMVFGPATTSERLIFQQSDETFGLTVVLMRKTGEEIATEGDVETLKEALGADPRIVLAIRDAWFSDWIVDPTNKSFTWARMEFACTTVADQ